MNIFILDENPILSAQYQCDKHVVKMILESAQLLCGVFDSAPYKRTHYNHPCAKWVRESLGNFTWLKNHAFALCQEYTYRYEKVHKSASIVEWCSSNTHKMNFELFDQTPFVQCVPDKYKSNDAVLSYRNYYINDKKSFCKWSKRQTPEWWS